MASAYAKLDLKKRQALHARSRLLAVRYRSPVLLVGSALTKDDPRDWDVRVVVTLSILSHYHALCSRNYVERPAINILAQREVIADLQELGYIVFHARAARTADGWATPVAGDGVGYPDITAVHPSGRCLIAELKAGDNRLSDAQVEWLRVWSNVPGVTVLVVRPETWDEQRGLL